MQRGIFLYDAAHKRRTALCHLCKRCIQYYTCPTMYDYDPNKVSMSRLRLSYELNDHEAAIVMGALWPHALFPLELWRKAYDLFWRGFSNSVAIFYSIESVEFSEHNVTEEKYFHAHLYAQDMENLFSTLASRIHVNALREGFRYILSMTYQNIEEISFKDQKDSVFEKLSMIEENMGYKFYQRLAREEFLALFEEKMFCFPPQKYFFISKMYPDTILVDTVSAIRHLYWLKIPFKVEVKGITRALVDSVINSLSAETRKPLTTALTPQDQATTPASTGSRKDIRRINATRKTGEELVKELLQEKHVFENNKGMWKPTLLYSNGKTNWDTFSKAAQARLGNTYHHDEARNVWKEISGNLKHNGRMPEQ